jgi:hypothetical protein
MEISLIVDDNLSTLIENLSTLGVNLSTFWIYLSFSKFRHPLLRLIFQEQKRKLLDQPRANKPIRNRRCFLPSIPDWLRPKRQSRTRRPVALTALARPVLRGWMLCAYPQYKNFINS